MLFLPAIDLKDGNCVRLYKGDMNQATVFSDSPADQAASFAQEGAEMIHVVDLNGAIEGKPVNHDAVRGILDTVDIPVQLGGGIRDLKQIETWLDLGVARVILGTIALRNPELVKQACKAFPQQIIVGIDGKNEHVAVEGWVETSSMTVRDLALAFEEAGAAAIIYTDIARDGAMEGPNIESTRALAQAISTPVIASGGVSSLDDLHAVKKLASDGVSAVISGRAIYENAFSVKEAIAVLAA